jgi:hypothetical protein
MTTVMATATATAAPRCAEISKQEGRGSAVDRVSEIIFCRGSLRTSRLGAVRGWYVGINRRRASRSAKSKSDALNLGCGTMRNCFRCVEALES